MGGQKGKSPQEEYPQKEPWLPCSPYQCQYGDYGTYEDACAAPMGFVAFHCLYHPFFLLLHGRCALWASICGGVCCCVFRSFASIHKKNRTGRSVHSENRCGSCVMGLCGGIGMYWAWHTLDRGGILTSRPLLGLWNLSFCSFLPMAVLSIKKCRQTLPQNGQTDATGTGVQT